MRYERSGGGGAGDITIVVDAINSGCFTVWSQHVLECAMREKKPAAAAIGVSPRTDNDSRTMAPSPVSQRLSCILFSIT